MTHLPDLRESLVRAAYRQRELHKQDLASPDADLSRRSQARAWLRAAPGAAAVLAAVGVAVAIAIVALSALGHNGKTTSSAPTGRRPSHLAAVAPQQPNISSADWTYIKQARHVIDAQDPSCSAFTKNLPATSAGQPSAPLTSILGVLNLRANRADKLSEVFAHRGADPLGSIREIYINDIRLARTVAGTSFYIIPAGNVTGFRTLSNRCIRLEAITLRTELPGESATDPARLLKLQRSYLTWEQYQAAHPEGICLAATTATTIAGSESLTCGSTIADIEQGHAGLGATASSTGNTLLHGIVPDGVATVTLRYPPTPGKSPAVTITTKVINNVFVIQAPDIPSELPKTIGWHAPSGGVIKTIQYP
jgi:hypothetical protein